jgi:hypothetical protein
MLLKSPSAYLLAVLCALIVTPAHALVPRAYVASYGDDSNISSNCSNASHPCRWFFTAVNMVQSDGEVVAIDTSNYGPVTLTKSISLTAAPGIYAGIAVGTGATGITIATPNVNVVLRGLTINGQGGNYGVSMTNGTRLSIENCVISNFKSGSHGISVNTAATVRVVNTLVRDNDIGILLDSGATADISGSKFLGNDNGIVSQNTAGVDTTVTISDTIVTGGGTGIESFSGASGKSRINIVRSSITSTIVGIATSATVGTAWVTLSDSMVTGNTKGYSQTSGGTLRSLVNNIITDNGSNTGSLTTLSPL